MVSSKLILIINLLKHEIPLNRNGELRRAMLAGRRYKRNKVTGALKFMVWWRHGSALVVHALVVPESCPSLETCCAISLALSIHGYDTAHYVDQIHSECHSERRVLWKLENNIGLYFANILADNDHQPSPALVSLKVVPIERQIIRKLSLQHWICRSGKGRLWIMYPLF